MIDSNAAALDTHSSSTATQEEQTLKESTDRPWMNRSSSTLEPAACPICVGVAVKLMQTPPNHVQPCPARDQNLPGSPPSYFLFGKGPGESLACEAISGTSVSLNAHSSLLLHRSS